MKGMPHLEKAIKGQRVIDKFPDGRRPRSPEIRHMDAFSLKQRLEARQNLYRLAKHGGRLTWPDGRAQSVAPLGRPEVLERLAVLVSDAYLDYKSVARGED